MKAFKLFRLVDESGVSGTGYIAEGIEFANGQCVIHWLTHFESIGVYPSVDEIMKVHGHGNRTLLVRVSVLAPMLQIVTGHD